jgi:16S rRNA (cytidine1402-2'-O)-methyltransferase
MVSCFEQKEKTSSERLMRELSESGEHWCLLSDAGTPAVSDPGSMLVEFAHHLGIKVIPLPGPSALTTLLSASGFKQGDVMFLGFLERKKDGILRQINQASSQDTWRRIVFFESPHRIESTLQILTDHLSPEPQMVIGREMTKLYEQIVRGTPRTLLSKCVAGEIQKRGEFVCALEIPPLGQSEGENNSEIVVQKLLQKGLTAKDIFELSEVLGLGMTLNAIRGISSSYKRSDLS